MATGDRFNQLQRQTSKLQDRAIGYISTLVIVMSANLVSDELALDDSLVNVVDALAFWVLRRNDDDLLAQLASDRIQQRLECVLISAVPRHWELIPQRKGVQHTLKCDSGPRRGLLPVKRSVVDDTLEITQCQVIHMASDATFERPKRTRSTG